MDVVVASMEGMLIALIVVIICVIGQLLLDQFF